MFVIVKQERFATVSVGILKLLFPHFITGSQSEGIKVFVYMKVICSELFLRQFFLLLLLLWMFCFGVKRFYCGLCVASAVLLKLAKMYFWLTLWATSRGLLLVLNRGGRRVRDPQEHMLLVLSPSTMMESRPVSVIANGRQGQGSYLSQNGFSTAVHRSLHEHMTK